MKLVHESILTELKATGKLPSPASVALTILDLTRNPDASTEDITMVMKGDPALSGQVLKYANSSASGVREEVTTVNQALVHLGMKVIQQLCLGLSVLSSSRSGKCQNFDYPRYWTRSLARGIAAQVLSSQIPATSPEEGFTVGLLADIGALGLANVYPREYSKVLDSREEKTGKELTNLEMEALSINRHQVTWALFEDWGLPEHFQEAIMLQDREEEFKEVEDISSLSRGQNLARLLSVSCMAAKICVATGARQNQLVQRFMRVGEFLNIPEESWIELFDLISAEWKSMGHGMDVPTKDLPSMKILMNAAEQPESTDQLQDIVTEIIDVGHSVEMEIPEVPTGNGLDILVVTDNDVEQKILQKMLSLEGHNLTLVQDGHQALEVALQNNPQLILANWSLPSIEGLELARMIRKSAQMADTYFIIMTSHDGQDSLVEAFEAGIDDYLVKPLKHDVLNARLKAATRIIELQMQSARDREDLRQTLTELSILSRQLEHMALEDELTCLPNRRAGLTRFDQEWSRANRNKSSLLCMLLDIDHFKKVNDTYGHDAGDVVLQETARVMKEAIRDTDVICRYGGEEFLVICPEADLDMAMVIGDRIRQAVQNSHIKCGDLEINVTISIGVALRTGSQDSPKDLIKESDEALYAAKENGRNKVCIYSD